MIIGLDSSASVPSAAQATAARDAGIHLWSGYLSTRANVGLYHSWTVADFDNARICGATPIAFASGWDDPLACKEKAAAFRVRLCLDVESGIRGDGAWVQSWLDISSAGLYGQHAAINGVLHSIHMNRRAAFHIGSWYVFRDPGVSWYDGRPGDGKPCGWQWQNTHNEFGASVDRGYYDDWFLNSSPNATAGSEVRVQEVDMLTPQQKANWLRTTCQQLLGRQPTDQEGKDWATPITGELKDDGSNVDACYLKIYNGQESQNYRAKLDRAIASQAGTPPVDVSQFAKAVHGHEVKGTAS